MDWTTNHAQPWALVKRGGNGEGNRPCTRLAYLTDTYVPRGERTAKALKGHFVRLDRHERPIPATMHAVVIPWGDIVKYWTRQPSAKQVADAKRRLKPTAVTE